MSDTPKAKAKTKEEKQVDKIFDDMRDEAEKDLAAFDMVRKFETREECKDKDGQPTKVLIIDIDASGVLALELKHGNPHKVNPVTGDTITDGDKLQTYVNAMSNIELSSSDNLSKIGRKALTKARSMVADFFMLILVSELERA